MATFEYTRSAFQGHIKSLTKYCCILASGYVVIFALNAQMDRMGFEGLWASILILSWLAFVTWGFLSRVHFTTAFGLVVAIGWGTTLALGGELLLLSFKFVTLWLTEATSPWWLPNWYLRISIKRVLFETFIYGILFSCPLADFAIRRNWLRLTGAAFVLAAFYFLGITSAMLDFSPTTVSNQFGE